MPAWTTRARCSTGSRRRDAGRGRSRSHARTGASASPTPSSSRSRTTSGGGSRRSASPGTSRTARTSRSSRRPASRILKPPDRIGAPRAPTSRDRFHAVMAGYLGWTMDAFDFFVVVFLVDTLAVHFGVPKKEIVWTLTATLALRPVGAVIFGLLADRYGRRVPLMANLLFFSTVEVACGFAPNYATFLVLRALFGIGMGGEWGVGASLAMESAPPRWRGLLSGVLQSGYSIGYLLAAVAARLVLPAWGWRAMFWIGGVPALLAFYVRWHVPESEAWKQHRAPSWSAFGETVRRFLPRLGYLVALMTMMMFLSHGTQDLYPDFLKIEHGIAPPRVAEVAILYNVGAVI